MEGWMNGEIGGIGGRWMSRLRNGYPDGWMDGRSD